MTWNVFLPAGQRRTPDRLCPKCFSVERHRLIEPILSRAVQKQELTLEIGPSDPLSYMARTRGLRLVTGDLSRPANLRLDVRQLPFRDRSIPVIVLLHVLEHVPEDRTAIRELSRVLADDGVLIVQTPVVQGATDEEVGLPESLRITRFGQADHVRLYGREDLEVRLMAGRFDRVIRWPAADVLPPIPRLDRPYAQPVYLCCNGESLTDPLEGWDEL